jgi:hypothetical protein
VFDEHAVDELVQAYMQIDRVVTTLIGLIATMGGPQVAANNGELQLQTRAASDISLPILERAMEACGLEKVPDPELPDVKTTPMRSKPRR